MDSLFDSVASLADIDECAVDRSLCQPYGSCENRPGSYMCVCNHGYILSEDKHSCEGKPTLTPATLRYTLVEPASSYSFTRPENLILAWSNLSVQAQTKP